MLAIVVGGAIAIIVALVTVLAGESEEERLCGEIWQYHVQIVGHENYAIWNEDEYNDHFYRNYVEYGEDAHMDTCPTNHQHYLNEYIEELIENVDELDQIR